MKPASIGAMNEDWPRLSALLDEALNLPLANRDAWLDGLTDVSDRHRASLRALLATQAEIETGDFLAELPPLPPSDDTAPCAGAAAGALVGPYRLVSQIGQGGMASVWLAERADGVMKRQVALKLPAVAWGEAFATRLAREREILASLTHDHIARLYDAGVDALGRPFLAMEFIDGQPIDAFCRHRQLPLADRVGLLLQVMAAVSHAHARLVVHRDLKPSNILVSADGKVSLLDFGIAKLLEGELTEETALTRAAGHALTPDYASPEQIRGEPLGTGTDVYSLAVVAYELLSGSRPYRLKRGRAADLAQAVADVQAPLASATALEVAGDKSRQRQLQGDLDAILNKALKKRPEDRYLTMDAFAQDLQRWRDGAPVQARPDGLGYRAAKFVGRYRLQVAAGGVVAMALVAGTTVALWQAREARTEAATAKAVQNFMLSVFLANTGNQDDPKRARETTARELLDRGADRAAKELADVPAAQLALFDAMAEMYLHMGVTDRTVQLQRSALELTTRLYGPDSAEAVSATTALAKTLLEVNQRDEARALLLQADMVERRRGDADVEERAAIDSTLAYLFFNVDAEQALSWARRAAHGARKLATTQDTINALQMLGETANITGHFDEAQTALAEAQAQIERHPAVGEGGLPLILATLGEVQDMLGRTGAARATMERAMDLAQRTSDPYSLHIVSFRWSKFLCNNGLLHEAVEQTAKDYEWSRGEGSNYAPMPVFMAGLYARALTAVGDPVRALEVIDAAVGLLAGLPGAVAAPLVAYRADALIASGRAAEAGPELERAAGLAERHDSSARVVRQVRRRYWLATGQPLQALEDLRAEARADPSKPGTLLPLRRQAEEAALLLAAGRVDEARALAADTLAGLERLPERPYARVAEARSGEVLGRALLKQGHVAEAVAPLEQAVALRRVLHQPTRSPELADALQALAESRHAQGNAAAAAAAEAEAARIRAALAAGVR